MQPLLFQPYELFVVISDSVKPRKWIGTRLQPLSLFHPILDIARFLDGASKTTSLLHELSVKVKEY